MAKRFKPVTPLLPGFEPEAETRPAAGPSPAGTAPARRSPTRTRGGDRRAAPAAGSPARTAAGKSCRADGLGHRLPFAHPPGVSRPARDDQSAGRAGGGGLRFRPRPAVPVGERSGRIFSFAPSTCRARPFATRCTRTTRRIGRRCPTTWPRRSRLPSGGAGVGDSGLGAGLLRGRRHPGHHRPAGRATRRPLLSGHQRQGLPAAHLRSGEALQHPQERGPRPRRPAGRLGDQSAPGRRLPGLGGRRLGQRAGRAADRAGLRAATAGEYGSLDGFSSTPTR